MAARAVLIGAETYGLAGCHGDVALMNATLHRRDFDTTCLTGPDATRRSILSALDDLIAATGPGDAAVIYFSGHGGRLVRPDADDRSVDGRSPYFQFIVPTDMEASAPGDFRGVMAEELSVVQRRLTAGFAGHPVNAVTILDCCHSGYMARNVTARSRAVDLAGSADRMFTVRGILEHVDSLVDHEVAAGETNPHIVRAVACQAEQSAFELPSRRGATHGAFTDALVSVLDDVGDASISWAMLGDLVRRRVRAVLPEQRPEIEGPGRRAVFGESLLDDAAALPLVAVGDEVAIPAADLLGVGVGDEIRLLAPATGAHERTVVVTAMRDGNAIVDVGRIDHGSTIAVPVRLSVPPIHIDVDRGPGRDDLVDAVERRPRLTTQGRPGDERPVVRLRAAPNGWYIDDGLGIPWRNDAVDAGPGGIAAVVDTVESIAVGHRLLDLPNGTGDHELGPDVAIELTRSRGGRRERLAPYGERLHAGANVMLTLRNVANEPRFVWIFDVGVSGRSSLVTAAAPSGMRLGPAGDEDDTLDIWRPPGAPLYWPDDVPAVEAGRNETFVVVVADRRNDLSALASTLPVTRGAVRSPLDALIDEARFGTREVAPSTSGTADALRYRLDRIEFVLVPESS